MPNRYRLDEGSNSAHCCFEFTIVDTHRPVIVRGEPFVSGGEIQYEIVCECYERADAELVWKALNAMEAGKE